MPTSNPCVGGSKGRAPTGEPPTCGLWTHLTCIPPYTHWNDLKRKVAPSRMQGKGVTSGDGCPRERGGGEEDGICSVARKRSVALRGGRRGPGAAVVVGEVGYVGGQGRLENHLSPFGMSIW